MNIVSTSYISSLEFRHPEEWLMRINGYTGILESLASRYKVMGIERIGYEGVLDKKGVQYFFIKTGKGTNYFPVRAHKLIKKLKADIVIVNGFIFPLQIIQLKLALGKKARIVVMNRAEKPGIGVLGFLQKLADRCVYKYIFTSKEMGLPWVSAGIISGESKIAGIMCASSVFSTGNSGVARIKTGISGSPVFLFVGRLDANKDPLTILRAFSQYCRQQPMAKLYIVHQTDELLGEINQVLDKDPVLQHAVKMVGKISHAEMQDWYNSADYIISASHYEGGGVAVCEAMSCGCIPILTNIPSFRSLTGWGKCGFLYEPGNAGDLLNVLLQTETMNRNEEKEKTLRQFRDDLSFEAIAAKLDSVINTQPV